MSRARCSWSLFIALACALVLPVGASASVTIGPSVPNPEPSGAQAINWPDGSLLFTVATTPGTLLAAPSAGVITRWKMYTDQVGAGASVQLRTLQPGAGKTFTPVASGAVEPIAPVSPALGELKNVVHSFSARLPIAPGQIVGYTLHHASGSFFVAVLPAIAGSSWKYGCLACGGVGGVNGVPETATVISEQWVALNADIEPDVDGDVYGDETQDNCPGTANPTQADGDGDGRGDACDRDPTAAVVTPSPVVTPKKCAKGKKLKHGKCVKKHRPKKKTKK
jgi:hypothetical protein